MDYQNQLEQINGLKWLPWIGSMYAEVPSEKRILIIGESHYHDNTPESIAKHEELGFTREVVEEIAIEQWYYGTKIFGNIHRALFRTDSLNAEEFWNSIAFYNFIQRPMATKSQRPNYDDWVMAWKVFFGMMETLEPAVCLFFSSMAAGTFAEAATELNYQFKGVRVEECIGRCYARTASVFSKSGREVPLLFCRHPSQYFSWSAWNEYLERKIPEQIEWMKVRAGIHA